VQQAHVESLSSNAGDISRERLGGFEVRYGSYWDQVYINCPQCEKDYDEQNVLVIDGVYTWNCPVCKFERSVDL